MFDLHFKWQLRTLLTVLMNTPERTPKHLSRYNLICTIENMQNKHDFSLNRDIKRTHESKTTRGCSQFLYFELFCLSFFSNIIVFGTFFKNCEIFVSKEALNQVLLNILCCQKNVRVPILGQSIIDLIATLSTHWTTQFHGNTRKIFCLFFKKRRFCSFALHEHSNRCKLTK